MAILSRIRLVAALLVLLAAAWSGAASAQSATDARLLERHIKAALLSQFAELVTWPQAALGEGATPIHIAVWGADQLADDLGKLAAGRSAAGHPIRVRRHREGEPISGIQILFVGGPATAGATELIRTVSQQPVLIVTESEGALAHGSVINFAMVEGKVRFEISTAAAEQRGLKLSPRLVAVALKKP